MFEKQIEIPSAEQILAEQHLPEALKKIKQILKEHLELENN